MRAALLLALAALPPAHASAATCHTYTPAEQADATLMCASAVDYEFSMPAGFHPDEAARALVGGDDAAESARLHASLDAPCKAALKKLACLSTHATCGATSQPCQATCDAVSSVCPAHVLTDLGVTCSTDATTCVSGQDVAVGAVTEAYEGTACAGLVTDIAVPPGPAVDSTIAPLQPPSVVQALVEARVQALQAQIPTWASATCQRAARAAVCARHVALPINGLPAISGRETCDDYRLECAGMLSRADSYLDDALKLDCDERGDGSWGLSGVSSTSPGTMDDALLNTSLSVVDFGTFQDLDASTPISMYIYTALTGVDRWIGNWEDWTSCALAHWQLPGHQQKDVCGKFPAHLMMRSDGRTADSGDLFVSMNGLVVYLMFLFCVVWLTKDFTLSQENVKLCLKHYPWSKKYIPRCLMRKKKKAGFADRLISSMTSSVAAMDSTASTDFSSMDSATTAASTTMHSAA